MAVRFGEYTAGDGAAFTYHLTYDNAPGGVRWHAVVRDAAGALLCTPKGIIDPREDHVLDHALRSEITRAIDLQRAGVAPGRFQHDKTAARGGP